MSRTHAAATTKPGELRGLLAATGPQDLATASDVGVRLGRKIHAMPSASLLYGRGDELAVLEQALTLAASGRRAIALLHGEAGIGKSRLLDAAAAAAADRGMQVAAARAVELEQTRPFGLIATALGCVGSSADRRRAAIADLLTPEVGGGTITVTSDPGLQFRVIDAIVDLVEELALAGPLAILVDDLQWADPSSLLTLGAITRRIAYLPVALIGCRRTAPHSVELDRLLGALDAVGALGLPVGPLDQVAARALAAAVLTAQPGPGLLAQIEKTAGNPLFMTELLAAFLQDGTIHIENGLADMPDAGPPPILRLTIVRRLSFLSDATLTALRAASILGSSFTVSELSVTTAQSALDLSVTLGNAIAAGLLEVDGQRLRFRHDLIRDAIYADLPRAVRCALHLEAGQRLAASGTAPVQRVAEQLSRGATHGDAQAIEWLTRAAQESGARSPLTAADLLRRAIEIMDPADGRRDHSILELAQTLMRAGRVTMVAEACRDLLGRRHDQDVDGPARLYLGRALLLSGRGQDALDELARAAQAPELSGAERASVLCWASVCHIWLAELDDASGVARQAKKVADAAGDQIVPAMAVTVLGVASRLRGDLAESIRFADQAVALADGTLTDSGRADSPADPNPRWQGHRYPVHAPRGYVLIELDRLAEARSTIDAGVCISQELGTPGHLASYQMVRAVERYTAGEWDDALAEIESTVELEQETGEAYGLAVGRSIESLISLHRNDMARARTAAAAAIRLAANSSARYDAQRSERAHALVLEADGNPDAAYTALIDVWEQCTKFGLVMEYRVLGPDLVRMARAAGDIQRAHDVATAVETLAERNDLASLTAIARRCRGLADDDPETLDAAVALYASGTRPLERALACEDAGAAYAKRGQLTRARDLLEQSLPVYRHLGAARDLARAEATLRGAGIRLGRRGPRKRPLFGWQSLTPTEHTVVELVAEGLTNPQIGRRLFISPRTVQTHLAHVFGKLGIATRTQLAAEVARRSPRGRSRPA